MKILHFSDLHLDASFASLGMTSSVASQRRHELRAALRRIFDKARELSVDAVTIGGDLYEHERETDDTARFLKQQFEQLAPIPILVSPGNHDPYVPDSIYHRITWSSNVHIFREPRFTPHQLAPDITLWGAGHNSPSLRDNLLSSFRPVGPGTHLLLCHGSDLGSVPPGKVTHCPFTVGELRSTGAKFALLGHYHGAAIRPEAAPLYCYPGSPEPLGFDEEGPHYVLLLEIEGDSIKPQLLPINAVQYHREELDVSDIGSSDDIRARIDALTAQWGSTLIRVTLIGSPHVEVDIDLAACLSECAPKFRFLDLLDRTYPAYNLEELGSQVTAKGRFVKKMREKIQRASADERPILQRALDLGLRALDGRTIRVL